MKIAKTVKLVGYQSGIVEKEKFEASKTSVVMPFFLIIHLGKVWQ